jgi:hypothetical protein
VKADHRTSCGRPAQPLARGGGGGAEEDIVKAV